MSQKRAIPRYIRLYRLLVKELNLEGPGSYRQSPCAEERGKGDDM
jgi:hypothetical protein